MGEERTLANVVYDGGCDGGCDGGTQGIAVMAEGRQAADVVKLYKDVVCANKKSGSSCPDQCAKALAQAKVYLTGAECTGCDSAA